MTSEDTSERISSPAPGSGRSPQTWPDGVDLFGQPLVPASRSQSQAKAPVETTRGICGPTSFDSPAPCGPLSSWVSRLQDRLASIGSTESPLIWREKATPAGRSIFRLAPWTPPIAASGSIGSPWPTPMAGTPAQNGNNYAGNNDSIRRLEVILGLRETPNGSKSHWPTPTVADVEGGRKTRSGARGDEMLLNGLLSGVAPNGSNALTEKRGAPNPEFACWLMGWPDALTSGAWRAIASCRRSRHKSLPRSTKP